MGRKGPGGDYPAVFTYHARGLPVQVVDETSEWRKICDPDGGVVWVASAMVDGRRTVMAEGQSALALRKGPDDAAAAGAYLRPRAIAALGRCRAGWCEVNADGAAGWVRQTEVWGLATRRLTVEPFGLAAANGRRYGHLQAMTQKPFRHPAICWLERARRFGPGNAQLPALPILMFDRITHIGAGEGPGRHNKGQVVAEALTRIPTSSSSPATSSATR